MASSVAYIVLRAIAWDAVQAGGFSMKAPPNGPQWFMPVFDTQEQAVAFANDGDHIMEVRLNSSPLHNGVVQW